ncbi:hypothetical protein [Collimonas fungivorans]|uniref:hypothetical protein n=1 Tax=Collimonas fungivorans TaxID=158899 RepID=UPI000B30D097|nr:hypothetical protein [Collimonas fungivorans]
MIENFQLILLGGTYDAVNNPSAYASPWGSNLVAALAVGCRWQNKGVWVTKFQGFPEQARRQTIDANTLSDHSGVVFVEIDYDYSRNNNAVIFNPDGGERIRLTSPYGQFTAVNYENDQLGFLVCDDRNIERWYAYDVAANEFTRWHPVR